MQYKSIECSKTMSFTKTYYFQSCTVNNERTDVIQKKNSSSLFELRCRFIKNSNQKSQSNYIFDSINDTKL